MVTVFIIHGTEGSPEGNWFPWLKIELEKLGCRVFVPRFPTPENQNLESWMMVFEKYKQYLDGNSIVVGHSLGPAFLLNVLERYDRRIKAAFFIAGFTGLLGNRKYDDLNKTFADRSFDWKKIKGNCKKFYVISSDDDPYVPLERGRNISKNLEAEFIIIKNAGHINQEFGYRKFDLLLEKIKTEL